MECVNSNVIVLWSYRGEKYESSNYIVHNISKFYFGVCFFGVDILNIWLGLKCIWNYTSFVSSITQYWGKEKQVCNGLLYLGSLIIFSFGETRSHISSMSCKYSEHINFFILVWNYAGRYTNPSVIFSLVALLPSLWYIPLTRESLNSYGVFSRIKVTPQFTKKSDLTPSIVNSLYFTGRYPPYIQYKSLNVTNMLVF